MAPMQLVPHESISPYAHCRTDGSARDVYSDTGVRWIAVNTRFNFLSHAKANIMNSIIYIVGAVVIIIAILSFLGLR